MTDDIRRVRFGDVRAGYPVLASRRPVGAAFAVYHMHDSRLATKNVAAEDTGFDVARDRLIFNMGERTGNIWSTTLEPRH